jgi:hopene-associated glycosyltransferase HpnB
MGLSAWLVAWGALVLAFWLAVTLDRKRRWPRERLIPAAGAGDPPSRPDGAPPESRAAVLAVVPARDEADVLPRTLPALAAQAEDLALLVLADDRSTDGTAALAEEAARAAPEKVLAVRCPPPAPGWTGKLHALRTGLEAGRARLRAAGRPEPEWVLFTDADIFHPPGSVAALAARAAAGPFDLVSVMARLRAGTRWEQILIPPFTYYFHFLYPFRRVADPGSRVAAAAGGCVLVSARALAAAGGLEAIRGEVIDDVALATRVKRSGGRLWLGLEDRIASLRGYGSFRELADLVARTAFIQLGCRWSMLAGTLIALGLLFAAPPAVAAAGAASGSPLAAGLGLAAWGLQTASFLPAVRHARVHPLLAVTLPAATVLYGYMTALSAVRHARGAGALWKGRRYGQTGVPEANPGQVD